MYYFFSQSLHICFLFPRVGVEYEFGDTKLKIKLKSWDEEKVYEFKLEGDKLSLTPTDPYSPKYPELIKK